MCFSDLAFNAQQNASCVLLVLKLSTDHHDNNVLIAIRANVRNVRDYGIIHRETDTFMILLVTV